MRRWSVVVPSVALGLALAFPAGHAEQARVAPAPGAATLDALHAYVHAGWATLTRTTHDLPVAAVDPKFPAPRGARAPVYVSPRQDLPAVRRQLEGVLSADELARIELRALPAGDPDRIPPGLLYLPHPYVVPGGRFNEMYGWDSYFILRGLLADGDVRRAKDMTDDAIYEVQRFGKVLNANRSYYLGRSQPPFLTAMIRDVYGVTRDRAWLASTLPAVRRQYQYWTTPPHLAGKTGLSRYHAAGQGPAPEVVQSDRDALGRSHYDRVREALRKAPADDPEVARFYDRRSDRLTPLAYEGDRAVRESGFDTGDRFGRFSLAILDFAPVCLNSLLYSMERDTAAILDELGQAREAREWTARAERRARRIRELLWDDQRGLFLDYDFARGRRRFYPFAATFFPLWVGAATPEQARRVAASALPLLLRAGGLMTSVEVSGQQWDAPFGWAPLQLVAFEGLRRYGLDREADDLGARFLGTVLKEFAEHGAIFEKYDVVRRESEVEAGLRFGYASNEIGFGWTNGVFVTIERALGPAGRAAILRAAAP